MAARQCHRILAARSHRRCAARAAGSRRVCRAHLGLRRGALDREGGDRRVRAGSGSQCRSLPALLVARRGGLRGQAALGDASRVRGPPGETVKVEVLPDAEAVARRAAALIAQEARAAAAARGRFVMATSGGATPWRTLELLASEDVPWPLVHLFQVDERVTTSADPARNFTKLRATLLDSVPLPEDQVHAMPVEENDLSKAAERYAATLREVAGTPPRLDLIQLGLGADGHTASLLPGDSALDCIAS